MRVLLIIPPGIGRYEKPTIPHAGIAYLAAVLREHDHPVRIADMRLDPSYELLSQEIDSWKPDLLGITSPSRGYLIAYSLIERLKRHFPKLPIAIGGPHASTIHEQILTETKADYAIIGEGEYTLLELAEKKPLPSIKGLAYRSGKGSRGSAKLTIKKNPLRDLNHSLDTLPFPAYDLFEIDRFIERRIPIISSRGCPFQCTYCSVQLVMGRPFRYRSPENVVDEIEHWVKVGFTNFEFSDDNFSCIPSRAEKVCDLIIGRKLNISFQLGNGIRADKVNESLIRKLKQAGCTYIAYGIESTDPVVIQAIKKHEPRETVEKAIRLTQKHGIKIQGTFIIGLPCSTFESFLSDLRFSRELGITNVRFYNLVPYPHTEAYEWVKRFGTFLFDPETYLNEVDYWDENPVFETPEFPREQRIKAYRIGQMNYMRLFLRDRFGPAAGSIIFTFYKNDFIRTHFLGVGKKIYMVLKRLQAVTEKKTKD